jgi:hypothetical protein
VVVQVVLSNGGGGGAGGYRTNYTSSGPTPSPKGSGGGGSVESAFTATFGTAYTVTVGAGGAGQAYANRSSVTSGSNSVFSTITSIGGGGGGRRKVGTVKDAQAVLAAGVVLMVPQMVERNCKPRICRWDKADPSQVLVAAVVVLAQSA